MYESIKCTLYFIITVYVLRDGIGVRVQHGFVRIDRRGSDNVEEALETSMVWLVHVCICIDNLDRGKVDGKLNKRRTWSKNQNKYI